MRVTYDPAVNAAYIYLREIEPGGSRRTISVNGPDLTTGSVVLDFDSEGRLIGIEVLEADRLLTPDLLKGAEPPGQRPNMDGSSA
jgi:uncharacterized protein YuzE